MDLLSALTSHYAAIVQQGLLCGNFKCTQDILGYLSKVQGLDETQSGSRVTREEYNHREENRWRPSGIRREDRPRNRGPDVNVCFARRTNDRRHVDNRDRPNDNAPNKGTRGRGQGSVPADSSGRLNPEAPRFNPFLSTVETARDVAGNSRNGGATALPLNR
jgi:hypothetical protein